MARMRGVARGPHGFLAMLSGGDQMSLTGLIYHVFNIVQTLYIGDATILDDRYP